MPKSYRIRTKPGVDQSIKIQLDQDFEYLEILSLKILQRDIYARVCSDYGVVVGRVLVNGGFGVPNAKVSLFIPIDEEDRNNPIISELYPYRTLDDLNEDGYRYNLLPYQPSYPGHAATGTFPSREDSLLDATIVQVYDKYYKYTVKTNESGDYMIFGVPTGTQTVFMDVDLSDIGCFSLSPQDLINSGRATEAQVDGNKFKKSTNLRELPQIVTLNKIVEVQPLWGEPEICLLGITRVDFDLTGSANINIQPTAVFMGSVISTANEDSLKKSCKPKINSGNMCDLIAGPGQILAIRQTIATDSIGDPILEQYVLEEDGKIIDGDGTWLTNLPMNLDYVTTNEFGEQVLSNDPNVGIPTTAKYRFKIKWQNEEGLQNNFMRGNYLVPNIKEHGWNSSDENNDPLKDPANTAQFGVSIPVGSTGTTVNGIPAGGFFFNSGVNSQQLSLEVNGEPYFGSIDSVPLTASSNTIEFISIPVDPTSDQEFIFTLFQEPLFNLLRSYAFSLDWDDYYDKQEAIECRDTFYKFHYNKVYTVSSFIDRYKNGANRARHLGIKEITDRSCQSENNKLPVNDLVRNFDFLFFLFTLLLAIISPILVIMIVINHVLALLYPIVVKVVNFVIKLVNGIVYGICKVVQALGGKKECKKESLEPMSEDNPFKRLALPMMTYPDCEACSCPDEDLVTQNSVAASWAAAAQGINVSLLSDLNTVGTYNFTVSMTSPNNPIVFCFQDFSQVDEQVFAEGLNELWAGVQNPARVFYKVPVMEAVGPDGLSQLSGQFFRRIGQGMTLGQSLNMANLRARYFDGGNPSLGNNYSVNRIGITPNPSLVGPSDYNNNGNSYKDLALILSVDQGTTDQLVGKLITFSDPLDIEDINVTGATENQFGGNSITGTSVTGQITVPLTYMGTDGLNKNANITIVATEQEREYLYRSGIEYFQIVTGYTWEQIVDNNSPFVAQGSPSSNNSGVLWTYFANNRESYLVDNLAGSYGLNWFYVNDYQTQEFLILVRGVDPYTEKQEIKYDLSEIFGRPPETITVTGEYFLNVPIQQNSGVNQYHYDQVTPQTHATATSNAVATQLFHQPFNFVADPIAFSSFTTTSLRYYTSTDKSSNNVTHGSYDGIGIGSWWNSGYVSTNAPANSQTFRHATGLNDQKYIGRVDGGSFTVTNYPNYVCLDAEHPFNPPPGIPFYNDPSINLPYYARCYAPSYNKVNNVQTAILPPTDMISSQRLVFRSDRLPTSDVSDDVGNNSFPLHQNNNFSFYAIDEEGQTTNFSAEGDGVQGLNDLDAFSDLGTGNTSTIVETFSCEGMVPLKCYAGIGTNFTVLDPCDANKTGKDGQNKRVNEGCYYFVDDKLVKTIKDDIKYLAEWRVRFRIILGACRGVFGHMFQNNWINGVLYMPSFNKQTTYNIIGEPNYRFCNDIVMFNDISNNFYYRCTPYADNSNQFIGGPKPVVSNLFTNLVGYGSDDSQNTRQILFPTTIMDLGKRDEFISEICSDPDLSGKYLANTFRSTSYQDSSDVLQLAIISRLVNSTFLEQVLSIKNGGIEQFFDTRSGDRIDGDIAQAFSINSEYQVTPFIGGNYPDEYVFIGGDTSNRPIFGIFYNTNQEEYRNRRALSPGFVIYSFVTNPPLQTYVGYPDTQEVPFYKWYVNPDNSIFGSNANEWGTGINGGGFYKRGYQDLDVTVDEYFSTNQMSPTFPNIYYGFITNFLPPPAPPATAPDPPTAGFATPPISVPTYNNGFLVGAPYFFYFGLKNGKTALNRFIKIYLETGLE